jgi:hypothetical protein
LENLFSTGNLQTWSRICKDNCGFSFGSATLDVMQSYLFLQMDIGSLDIIIEQAEEARQETLQDVVSTSKELFTLDKDVNSMRKT